MPENDRISISEAARILELPRTTLLNPLMRTWLDQCDSPKGLTVSRQLVDDYLYGDLLPGRWSRAHVKACTLTTRFGQMCVHIGSDGGLGWGHAYLVDPEIQANPKRNFVEELIRDYEREFNVSVADGLDVLIFPIDELQGDEARYR